MIRIIYLKNIYALTQINSLVTRVLGADFSLATDSPKLGFVFAFKKTGKVYH